MSYPTKKTENALREILFTFGDNQWVTCSQIKKVLRKVGISSATFRKYVAYEKKADYVTDFDDERTIEDLVDILNNYLADDGWNEGDLSFKYVVIDGKVYTADFTELYCIKGLKDSQLQETIILDREW